MRTRIRADASCWAMAVGRQPTRGRRNGRSHTGHTGLVGCPPVPAGQRRRGAPHMGHGPVPDGPAITQTSPSNASTPPNPGPRTYTVRATQYVLRSTRRRSTRGSEHTEGGVARRAEGSGTGTVLMRCLARSSLVCGAPLLARSIIHGVNHNSTGFARLPRLPCVVDAACST